MRRKLGSVQHDVLESLNSHGWWSKRGCGWVWDNPSGTERVLNSLVRAGYVTVVTDQKSGTRCYYPISNEGNGNEVILSNGSVVNGGDVRVLLDRQYKILMSVSIRYKKDGWLQKAISDANLLGLEAIDRITEKP